VASLSQGRTAAAQCSLFTHKSVPVIFEPPCTYSFFSFVKKRVSGDVHRAERARWQWGSQGAQWCLGPQYGTCYMSPFWRLSVGGISYISRKFMDSCCQGRTKTLEGPGQAWNTAGGQIWGRAPKLQVNFW